jgi:hypothetical protein
MESTLSTIGDPVLRGTTVKTEIFLNPMLVTMSRRATRRDNRRRGSRERIDIKSNNLHRVVNYRLRSASRLLKILLMLWTMGTTICTLNKLDVGIVREAKKRIVRLLKRLTESRTKATMECCYTCDIWPG